MKKFLFLMLLSILTLTFSSCLTGDDDETEVNIQAELVGEYYLYYDNTEHPLNQEPSVPLEQCDMAYLLIKSDNTIEVGEYEDGCNRDVTYTGTWEYLGDSEEFEEAKVINVVTTYNQAEYSVEYFRDNIYMIYPNWLTFKAMTRQGAFVGYWKKV